MAAGIYQKQRLNLDLIGLASRITRAAIYIDAGRKGFAIRGKEQEGRVSYEDGIAEAMTAFQEAQISADPKTIFLLEYTFITQELYLCDKSDKDTINSLTNAIHSFDDAFLSLEVVEGAVYIEAEKTYPHHKDYRISGFPKDSFHIACGSHKTRIKNILRSPGIDPIEKELMQQRLANLSTAQGGYIEKQKKALGKQF